MRCLLLAVVLLLFSFSCRKNHDQSVKAASLNGRWHWIFTHKDYPDGPNNPETPQNTGIEEFMLFTDNSWKRIQNNITVDSATYTTGHNTYLPYPGAGLFVYDSVGFYKNNVFVGWDSYEVRHDTLIFGAGLSGRFSSYMCPHNEARYWVRQ
jgi:hypothetical protein